jgi:4-amino-4-deoxy-L-arabinose transferase-like glycosyltransferase
VSLFLAAASGLLADTYMPLARNPGFVSSPIGLLWPAATALLLVAVIALGFSGPWRTNRTGRLFAVLLAGSLLAVAVLDLVPPVARDELTHHLAVPALYLQAGRMVEIPFADQTYYPMLLTLLYTPLLALVSENAPKVLHLAFGLGSAALVCAYLRTRVDDALALFAALLLFTTPTVAALASSAYVDLALLFYSAAALIALLRWSETGRSPFLLASALAAGSAAGTKYNGVLVIVLLAAGVVLLAPERRGWRPLVALAGFGLVSLVPLVPWLVKNVAETGNPVFPLLNGLLGGRPLPVRPAIDVFSYRRIVYGESWLDIALVPVRVFLTGAEGDPARFDGTFNPLYLLGFAAALVPGASRRDRALAGFAGAFLLLAFFLVAFRSRYVIPVLIPLVLLGVEHLERWRGTVALPLAIAGSLLFNALHFGLLWARIDPLAFLSGRQTRAEYVTRFVPEYPVAAYANQHLPRGATVHLAFLGNRGYYWRVPYHYDMHYSGTTLREMTRASDTAGGVVRALSARGITHLASVDPLLERYMHDNLKPDEYARWREFVLHHLRPLYVHDRVGLYEIE